MPKKNLKGYKDTITVSVGTYKRTVVLDVGGEEVYMTPEQANQIANMIIDEAYAIDMTSPSDDDDDDDDDQD